MKCPNCGENVEIPIYKNYYLGTISVPYCPFCDKKLYQRKVRDYNEIKET